MRLHVPRSTGWDCVYTEAVGSLLHGEKAVFQLWQAVRLRAKIYEASWTVTLFNFVFDYRETFSRAGPFE